MNRKTIIGVVALCGLCLAAQATTTDPTYQLSFTTSGSTWYLWCKQDATSLPNDGLASFMIDITGLDGTTILSSMERGPVGGAPVEGVPLQGFFDVPRSDGSIGVDGLGRSSLTGLAATQRTDYGGPHDGNQDLLVVRRVGQVAGHIDFGDSFTCPALLARGTFSGPGTFAVTSAAGNALNLNWSGPGNVTPIVFTPEPASLSLLGLGGMALLRRKR